MNFKFNKLILATIVILLGINTISSAQTVTCSEFRDSLHLTSDTVYITQAVDTTINLGIQWMGFTDMSYMSCLMDYNDSTDISLFGGTVTGGLFSPYPSPVFFSVSVDYLQPAISENTTINAFIDFGHGNMVEICSIAVTLIINPSPVSVYDIGLPNLEATVFPNPMTNSATIEVLDEINSNYHFVIYDVLGKAIHVSEKISNRTHRLNRSVFKNSGIYFIEIKSENRKPKMIKMVVK